MENPVWFRSHMWLKHTERDMTYLSNVVERRPMLRVSGEILLAFCLATPLVLLLCFLV
jgi:hypothetical protein